MKLNKFFYVPKSNRFIFFLEILTIGLLVGITIFQVFSLPSYSPNAVSVVSAQDKAQTESPANADAAESNQESSSESSGASARSGTYNLNTITEDQLTQLPGIGPSRAKSIVDFREMLGGFSSLEQLKDVKGIGEKTYEKIKPYLYVE